MRRGKRASPLSHTNWQPRIRQNYRKCMEKSRFSKNCQITGLLCTPDLVYCFFELVSYSFQGELGKYMNLGRISWLWIPVQIFKFPAILPWLPMMQLWAWTPLSHHNCWNTCEVFLRFPFNVDLEDVYAQDEVNSWNQHWGNGGKQYLCSWDE